jgi:predicted ATPase
MATQVVLTGGPGGGKTALIRELTADPGWRGRVLALPEERSTLEHSR